MTNTSRWYDSKTLTEKQMKYVKINCKGRSETPNEDQTRTFVQVVSNFVAQNPLLHVGVHCTHGFNRTGFLIAAYLVEKHDWGVDAAVQVVVVVVVIVVVFMRAAVREVCRLIVRAADSAIACRERGSGNLLI